MSIIQNEAKSADIHSRQSKVQAVYSHALPIISGWYMTKQPSQSQLQSSGVAPVVHVTDSTRGIQEPSHGPAAVPAAVWKHEWLKWRLRQQACCPAAWSPSCSPFHFSDHEHSKMVFPFRSTGQISRQNVYFAQVELHETKTFKKVAGWSTKIINKF